MKRFILWWVYRERKEDREIIIVVLFSIGTGHHELVLVESLYQVQPLLDGTLDLIDFSAIFCSEFYTFTFHLFCVLIFLVKSEVFLTQNIFFS